MHPTLLTVLFLQLSCAAERPKSSIANLLWETDRSREVQIDAIKIVQLIPLGIKLGIKFLSADYT